MTPDLLKIWIQWAGPGVRTPNVLCCCILMVMKHMVLNAENQCKGAGIEVDLVKLVIKVEEGKEPAGDWEDPPKA